MSTNLIMSSSNRTNIPNSLNEHCMPFTDNKSFKKNPRLIVDAKGVYLTNHEGKKMIDASSGLFCNPLGHGRKEITEAVSKQLDKLVYCQPFNQGFGGCSFSFIKEKPFLTASLSEISTYHLVKFL